MTKRLTNSEMSTWRECKRKWYLSTYRGLQRRGRHDFNRPLGIGSRVHDALQLWYDPDGKKDPLDYVRTSCADDIATHPDHEQDIRKEMDLCLAMLEGYLQWLEEEGADSDLRIIESEREGEAGLMQGVTLLAKLDARAERVTDGSMHSLEHKTGAMGVEPELLQLNTQMLTQHLILFLEMIDRGEAGGDSSDIIVNMLKKSKRTDRAKPPFYWREFVRHNREELRSHWDHVVAQANEILKAEADLTAGASHHTVCYPSPTTDCRWKCEFFSICAMHDDGSDVEAAIDDLYETHDPLERYATPS